ncbi:MAG: Dot/Icm type IV secretion system effector CoxH3 [Acidobacteriaceae bacterium]
MGNEIRSLFLKGSAGKLEALLNVGSDDPRFTAFVCHPHPLHGGTFHNKVVYHAMKALAEFGFHVLRFNFRGTGLSEGKHEEGRGEQDDVVTAIDFLWDEFGLPVISAGFSFGAATSLRASCPDPRIAGLISLGTPVAVGGRLYEYQFLESCLKPKLFVSGTNDEFGPESEVRRVVERAASPKSLTFIENADHFFVGRLDDMQAAIRDWVKTGLPQ